LLCAFLAFTTNTVTGGSATDSAEISRTMALGEIRAVAGGQSEAEERGDQEHILHFGRLWELVETFCRESTVHTWSFGLRSHK